MSRQVLALILGLFVLGLVTMLLFTTMETHVEVERVEETGERIGSALPIRILASASGEIRLDGRAIDLADLEEEIALNVAAADRASLPEPSFILVAGEDVDDAVIVRIMEALSQAGANHVTLDTTPAE